MSPVWSEVRCIFHARVEHWMSVQYSGLQSGYTADKDQAGDFKKSAVVGMKSICFGGTVCQFLYTDPGMKCISLKPENHSETIKSVNPRCAVFTQSSIEKVTSKGAEFRRRAAALSQDTETGRGSCWWRQQIYLVLKKAKRWYGALRSEVISLPPTRVLHIHWNTTEKRIFLHNCAKSAWQIRVCKCVERDAVVGKKCRCLSLCTNYIQLGP